MELLLPLLVCWSASVCLATQELRVTSPATISGSSATTPTDPTSNPCPNNSPATRVTFTPGADLTLTLKLHTVVSPQPLRVVFAKGGHADEFTNFHNVILNHVLIDSQDITQEHTLTVKMPMVACENCVLLVKGLRTGGNLAGELSQCIALRSTWAYLTCGDFDCGLHGYCGYVDNEEACVCDSGWAGENCDFPVVTVSSAEAVQMKLALADPGSYSETDAVTRIVNDFLNVPRLTGVSPSFSSSRLTVSATLNAGVTTVQIKEYNDGTVYTRDEVLGSSGTTATSAALSAVEAVSLLQQLHVNGMLTFPGCGGAVTSVAFSKSTATTTATAVAADLPPQSGSSAHMGAVFAAITVALGVTAAAVAALYLRRVDAAAAAKAAAEAGSGAGSSGSEGSGAEMMSQQPQAEPLAVAAALGDSQA